ncbi:MAG: hypothetical protein AB3X44_16050 [Leptothrix sp. (in: b-proteobacteria)]
MSFAARQMVQGMPAGGTINTTMTSGNSSVGGTFRGFKTTGSPTFGSITSNLLSDGKTITDFYDETVAPDAVLAISGFTSNPGQAYFTTAKGNATTKTSASATYGYAAGVATWTWLSNFGFPTSGSAVVQIS